MTDQLLAERHHIQPGEPRDYVVQNTTDIAAVYGMITNTLTLMLPCIAGISLIVGGVGIMNISLVSATERTRDIGIRLQSVQDRETSSDRFSSKPFCGLELAMDRLRPGVGASVGLVTLINAVSRGTKWKHEFVRGCDRCFSPCRGGGSLLQLLPRSPRLPP